MSNTLFLAEMHHRAEANDIPFDEVINNVVDEIADTELTHSAENLGGVAEIEIGPVTLSFNRVVFNQGMLHLKGPLGQTTARIEGGTDLSNHVKEFAKSHGDIAYEDRRSDE